MKRITSRYLRNYYIVFGLLLQLAGLLGPVAALARDRISQALQMPFPYEGREMTAQNTLTDFGRRTGLAVFAGDVSGEVTIENGSGTAETFLDAFAAQTSSVWWSDGAAIRIDPQSSIQRKVYAQASVSASELAKTLEFLDLSAGPGSVQTLPDGRLIVVTGPARFVSAVEEVILQLRDALDAERAGLPNVIKGRTAVAASVASRRDPAPERGQQEGTLQ